ncbi:MAG: DUF2974 domain-containing protein [Bacilli bacterium]|nr:DUF2974 domain-containing protein [Bacilli bacterium]
MNLFAYLEKYGGSSFEELPFGEIDALLLTELSYLQLEKISPYYVDGKGRLPLKSLNLSSLKNLSKRTADPTNLENLILKMAESPRFENMGVGLGLTIQDPRRVMQYASFTFFLPDGSLFLAFRGTDTTLLGWKENFQLAYRERLASHNQALEYAEQVLEWYPDCPVYIGGHSKGGNLASFVTLHLKEKDYQRVIASYNFDGPDFKKQPANFEQRKNKIQKYMTQEDVIGALFNLTENPHIIKATAKLAGGHNPFSWQVDLPAHILQRVADRSAASYAGEKAFLEAINQTSEEDIELAADALFKIFWSCETVHDLTMNLVPAFLKKDDALSKYTKDEKERITAFFERLFAALLESEAKKFFRKPKKEKR